MSDLEAPDNLPNTIYLKYEKRFGICVVRKSDLEHGAVAFTRADRVCKWKLDSTPDYEMWETECGQLWSFTEGGLEENNCHYCQYCGGRIET